MVFNTNNDGTVVEVGGTWFNGGLPALCSIHTESLSHMIQHTTVATVHRCIIILDAVHSLI